METALYRPYYCVRRTDTSTQLPLQQNVGNMKLYDDQRVFTRVFSEQQWHVLNREGGGLTFHLGGAMHPLQMFASGRMLLMFSSDPKEYSPELDLASSVAILL